MTTYMTTHVYDYIITYGKITYMTTYVAHSTPTPILLACLSVFSHLLRAVSAAAAGDLPARLSARREALRFPSCVPPPSTCD